jgi:hypothetical protein
MVERLAGDKLEVLVGAHRGQPERVLELRGTPERGKPVAVARRDLVQRVVILIGSTSVPYMSKASTSTVACTGS